MVRNRSSLQIGAGLWIAFNVLDIMITHWGLTTTNLREANPLGSAIMMGYGVMWAYAGKMFLVFVLLIFILRMIRLRQISQAYLMLLRAMNITICAGVLWNLWLVMK